MDFYNFFEKAPKPIVSYAVLQEEKTETVPEPADTPTEDKPAKKVKVATTADKPAKKFGSYIKG